ncbi:MAG: SprB repeat-containing protein [Saprospiraceae bacterium]|nr:SprB repeat-containing protein [Saprospiraceae bacterium]
MDNTGVYFAGEGRLGAGLDELRPTLMKFDHAGNLLWSRIHLRSPSSSARLYNMALFIENDTIVNIARGSLTGDDLTYSKMFFYKTNIDGQLLWAKSYSIPGGTNVAGIQVNPIPEGYIAQGTYNEGGNNERMFIARLTKNGDVVWAKHVNTAVESPGLAKPLSVVNDSFVVFASQTTQFDNSGNYDILFGKIPLNTVSDSTTCDLIENIDLVAETLGSPNTYDGSYLPNQVFEGYVVDFANVGALPVSLTVSEIPGCNCQIVVQDSCDLQLSFLTDLVCPFAFDGAVTVNPSGGVAPYIYTWENDTVFTNQLTGLDVGTYLVTVTDATGCVVVDSIELGAAIRPEVSSEVQDASCFGVNDGVLTIVADDPSLQFTYQDSPVSSQTVYDSLWPGGDQYFVVDTFGCRWVQFFLIDSPDKIQLSLPNSIEVPTCDSVQVPFTPPTQHGHWNGVPPIWSVARIAQTLSCCHFPTRRCSSPSRTASAAKPRTACGSGSIFGHGPTCPTPSVPTAIARMTCFM